MRLLCGRLLRNMYRHPFLLTVHFTAAFVVALGVGAVAVHEAGDALCDLLSELLRSGTARRCVIAHEHRVASESAPDERLEHFVETQPIKDVDEKLSEAEVAVLRLYTGPIFKEWNTWARFNADEVEAGREESKSKWATSLAVLYNAVLKLSTASDRSHVFRLAVNATGDEYTFSLPGKDGEVWAVL